MKRPIWLLMIVVLLILGFPSPVRAESNIAISGSFYRQYFQMVPGETLSTPDVYVVVFNHGSETVDIQLTSQSPAGVKIIFSKTEFSIATHEEERIDVGMAVGKDVIPGDYTVSVTANIKESGKGILVTGGAQQQAKLSVLGEAGSVDIETRLLTGELFQSEIHLYRKSDGQLSPVGLSENGKLVTRLTPGDYFVQAFYKDIEVAKQDFTLAVNEKKEIILQAQTIFIDGFSVIPNYYEGDKKIAFAKISYAIRNIYQPVKKIKAILIVNFNGGLLEETEIISLPNLDVGTMDGNYKYTPVRQWEDGSYGFKMQVFCDDQLYAQSPGKQLEVKIPGAINWVMIGIIAILVLLVAIFLAIVLIRRRR